MSSPILNLTGVNFTNGLGVGQDYFYVSGVQALTGANGLDGITTVGLNLSTLVAITIDGQASFWLLTTGAADPTDPNQQVQPLDYNAGTNNVHWAATGDFKDGLVGVQVTRASAQGIPSGVDTAITFDTVRTNTGEWNTTAPTRFTADTPGVYAVAGAVSFAANTSGQRNAYIRKNGSSYIVANVFPANASGSTVVSVSGLVYLLTGDYLELIVNQTSGGSLDAQKIADYTPEFSAIWIANPVATATQNNVPSVGTSSSTTGNTVTQPFSTTDVGWYRVFSGANPAVGGFSLQRIDQSDGSVLDCDIQFGVFGSPNTGVIQVPKNVMTSTIQGMDAVRVSYQGDAGYVDVHLILPGSWSWTHPIQDGYVDAPFVVPMPGTDGSLSLNVQPNVIASTQALDAPMITSSGIQYAEAGVTGWAAPTGLLSRATFDPSTVTLTQLAQHVAALMVDGLDYGWIATGIASSMLYTDMQTLANNLVTEGTIANITNIFRITAAPDTTVQGIYVQNGSANGKPQYDLQGYEWNSANTFTCKYSGTVWQIYNASGLVYNSSAPATPASPWLVTQWQNLVPANVTVTTVAPNIALTFNVLADTHTACFVTYVGDSTWNGVYEYVDTLNGKRRYYLQGAVGVDNKRIEWNGGTWNIKNDSLAIAGSGLDASTYPDQVAVWIGTYATAVTRIDAVDLASGCVVTGGGTDTDGVYVAELGVFLNGLLVYRRTDGARYLNGAVGQGWFISDAAASYLNIFAGSSTNGQPFPWQVSWLGAGLIVQEKNLASGTNWHV